MAPSCPLAVNRIRTIHFIKKYVSVDDIGEQNIDNTFSTVADGMFGGYLSATGCGDD